MKVRPSTTLDDETDKLIRNPSRIEKWGILILRKGGIIHHRLHPVLG